MAAPTIPAGHTTGNSGGVFTWTYHADDVVSGRYEVQFTASYGSGLTPARTIATEWLVHEVIA